MPPELYRAVASCIDYAQLLGRQTCTGTAIRSILPLEGDKGIHQPFGLPNAGLAAFSERDGWPAAPGPAGRTPRDLRGPMCSRPHRNLETSILRLHSSLRDSIPPYALVLILPQDAERLEAVQGMAGMQAFRVSEAMKCLGQRRNLSLVNARQERGR